jgi:hypothetical protein
MARDLTASMISATTANVVAAALLFKAEFDSGDLCAWTGYGDLTFGGDTYQGVGDLGGVDNVEETMDIRANGATVTLSGIPSSLLAIALAEPYQGRPATLYLAALNLTTGALIADPYPILSGRMDVMSIEEGADTATISLTVENNLIELTRSKERRYTHEDQQIDFPGDLGLEYVAGIQEKPLNWGVSSPAAATSASRPSPPSRAFAY